MGPHAGFLNGFPFVPFRSLEKRPILRTQSATRALANEQENTQLEVCFSFNTIEEVPTFRTHFLSSWTLYTPFGKIILAGNNTFGPLFFLFVCPPSPWEVRETSRSQQARLLRASGFSEAAAGEWLG